MPLLKNSLKFMITVFLWNVQTEKWKYSLKNHGFRMHSKNQSNRKIYFISSSSVNLLWITTWSINLIRTKQQYYESKIEDSSNKPNKLSSRLMHNNSEITDPNQIENKFFSYFSSIGQNLARQIPVTLIFAKSFLNGNYNESSLNLKNTFLWCSKHVKERA